jgi:membrane-bound lytic murein transglycosylase D
MDTVMVDKHISLSSICTILNMDIKLLYGLNPIYRTYIVNGTPAAPRKVIIPQIPSDKYAALYDALNNPAQGFGFLHLRYHHNDNPASSSSKNHNYITYKVKYGDTLKTIAARFDGISVKQLKEWNGLSSAQVQPGMKLKISKG